MKDSVAQFEQSTGLALPEDLETLFGSGVVLAMNGTGLDPSLEQSGDLSSVNVGLRLSGDSATQTAVLDKLDAALNDSGAALTLARQNVEDGVVVATNPAYARALSTDTSLGDQDVFKKAVPDAIYADSAVYLNLDQTASVVQRFSPPGQSAEVDDLVTAIEPLQAFGMVTYPSQAGRASGVIRVTFD